MNHEWSGNNLKEIIALMGSEINGNLHDVEQLFGEGEKKEDLEMPKTMWGFKTSEAVQLEERHKMVSQ